MSASVPVSVTVAVPSPETAGRPATEPSVSVPWRTDRVTVAVPEPMSGSEIVTALWVAAEKTRAVSSATLCAPGTVLTGASFTGVTVAVIVLVCGGAVPSVSETVKLPSASLPSCWKNTRLAIRSAWVKLEAGAAVVMVLPTSTVPCAVPVTV
jgi:hypothetical protein